MNKTRVLVTGGAGFIGSHIADACAERGDKVFSVDDLSFGKKNNLNPKAPNFKIDISDFAELKKIFSKARPDVVFHCAALARIQPSFQNPDRYFQVNAAGTRNILALARKFGVRKVVYSASSSAYGDRQDPSLREEMLLTTQSLHPYGSTKRMGEMLMRDMGDYTGGPQTVCLRYFNVYGPRQTTTIDGPYATVMGIFVDQLKNDHPLTIVPDGHQRRDFTWIGDVVKANLLAAISKVGGGEIINVGSAKSYSMWDVAKVVLGESPSVAPKELLAKGKCVMIAERRGEVRETLADISKAKKLLGWSPSVSLEDGIERLKRA